MFQTIALAVSSTTCCSWLVCLVVVLVFQGTRGQTIVYTHETTGTSGVQCGEADRHCLANYKCDGQNCLCPENMTGNAEIECVSSDEHLCYIAGDPDAHLYMFGQSGAHLDLPCRYRVARFITENIDGHSNHATCAIEVFVTNQHVHDHHVTSSAHVSLGIDDPVMQLHSHFEVYMTANTSMGHPGIYNYYVRVIKSDDSGGLYDVKVKFDEANNFVILEMPHCEARVKLRAFDLPHTSRQVQLPGVTVQVPQNAEFVDSLGTYPHAVCGTPSDSSDLLESRAATLGVTDAHMAILYDILNEKHYQEENPLWRECERAFSLFATSADKVTDLTACSPLLSDRHITRCLENAGLQPIDQFNDCMTSRQNGNDPVISFRDCLTS